jgi:hypothetical protein
MRSNVKREVAGDEPVRPRRRRQTPEERTLDVAAGRNKPARPVAEQTVESVRNAADGTYLRSGILGERWTPLVGAAKRGKTPREVTLGCGRVTG